MMGPGIIMRDYKILKDLGIFSQIRGVDGAGIYQVKSAQWKGTWQNWEQLHKTYSNFSSMMTEIEDNRKDKDYRDLFNNCQVDVVMGHVRWATVGNIVDGNAHPFVMSNIVGAHNGTLHDKKYEDTKKTDSELMFRDINERGLSTVLNELDKKSAFAISMYDKRDHCVYFTRNDDRTLSFAFLEARGVMYWASELGMLKYILDRAGEKYTTFSLKAHHVVKIYAPDVTAHNIQHDPGKIVQNYTTLKSAPAPVVVVQQKQTQQQMTPEQLALPSPTPVLTPKVETKSNVVQLRSKVPLKSFHGTCQCKTNHLNLLQVSYVRRDKLAGFRYDKKEDCIYCVTCDPLIQESVKEILKV